MHTAKYLDEVQELSDKGGGNLGLIGSTQVGNKGIILLYWQQEELYRPLKQF